MAEITKEMLDAAVAEERERCIGIVQLARLGEIDGDLRSIISRIKHGKSLEAIKAERSR